MAAKQTRKQKKKTAPRKTAAKKTAAKTKPDKAASPQTSSATKAKTVVRWCATLGLWAGIAVFGIVVYYTATLPDIASLIDKQASRNATIRIIDSTGADLGQRGRRYGRPVEYDELPRHLTDAVIATEDRRFFSHGGFDVIGFGRAVVTNLKAGHIRQGGSTLTQQLAKNLFFTGERSIKRKVQELVLAFWLEHELTKKQILSLYLHHVYFGSGVYGAEAAAQAYFAKNVRDLDLLECAALAGMLKAPVRYHPLYHPDRSVARARVVLDNMVAAGKLTKKEAHQAKTLSLPEKKEAVAMRGWFNDWVSSEAKDTLGTLGDDINVMTTLNPALQNAAAKALTTTLDNTGNEKLQGAVLVMEAETGAIVAMVGGRDYEKSRFNRATDARRQPGSAFKPVVYLTALENGYNPESIVDDAPITIDGWSPQNHDNRYLGKLSLTTALAKSVNSVPVRLAHTLGPEKVVQTASRLGLGTIDNPTPAMALGTEETTVLKLAAAYAVLANGGYGVWPHAITDIFTKQGKVLYHRKNSARNRIVSAKAATSIHKMLQAVVKTGTGKQAAISGLVVGGKTGTSQNNRDAWFAGFGNSYVCVVWVGHDDASPMTGIYGGGPPAQVFAQVLQKSLAGDSAFR